MSRKNVSRAPTLVKSVDEISSLGGVTINSVSLVELFFSLDYIIPEFYLKKKFKKLLKNLIIKLKLRAMPAGPN